MSANSYYAIEQKRILLEAEKIALFTKHGPTIGAYREAVLREYLRRMTPSSLRVTTGFVSPNDNHEDLTSGQSRQIDVLIHDPDAYAPLLDTEGMTVIRSQSLLACVEVKSQLTFHKVEDPTESAKPSTEYPLGRGLSSAYRWEGTLVDALRNIKMCADACKDRSDKGYLSAIFAFESNFDCKRLYSALDSGDIQLQLGIEHLRELPQAICVLDGFLVMFSEVDAFEHGEQNPIPHETFFNLIKATKGHGAYPFQVFSKYFYNHIGYSHRGRVPENRGINVAAGIAATWSHHFYLRSKNV